MPVLVLVVLALAGCSSTNRKAPVEERSTGAKPAASASAPVAATAASAPAMAEAAAAPASAPALPGAENAGKPGYHVVKQGETLRRIAQTYGQNWRDVARWNGLENPDVVEVGQVLLVVMPAAEARANAARIVAAGELRPAETRTATPSASASAAPPAASSTAPTTASSTAPTTASSTAPTTAASTAPPTPPLPPLPPLPPPAAGADATVEDIVWIWPAAGPVLAGFDEGRNKGLTIGGKAGDPVIAAADGRVVYAGSSLRGYGNLVIVKHSEVFLTAYAHNQALLVKDDQAVRRGQKIAEMGSSDADRVQLHFEIRRQGKPIDPAKMLPPR